MLRRQCLFFAIFCCSVSLLPGCASMGIKNGIPYFTKQGQWEPELEEDKWASAIFVL